MTTSAYETAWKRLQLYLENTSAKLSDKSTEKILVSQVLFMMATLQPETSSEDDA